MIKAGILREDDRVELIEGELVEMSPLGREHAAQVVLLTRVLSKTVRDRALLSVQNPVELGIHLEPQPDLALLRPRKDCYAGRLPGPADILLVIEVADTSLDADRDDKLPLYARVGIPEAWRIDLTAGAMEVHRRPGKRGYRQARRLKRGEVIAPLAFPEDLLRLEDILISP